VASISTDAQGNRRLLYTHQRKRQAIHLGQITVKVAQGIKTKIEGLLASLKANLPIDGQTAEWLAGLDDELHQKLSDKGLATARTDRTLTTLGAFIDAYHARHPHWKPNSVKNHKAARRWLVSYFGASKPISTITEDDAKAWRAWMGEQIGENTIRRLCGFAKQYFKSMKLQVDPFESMKQVAVQGNEELFYFVDAATAGRVLAACPDAEWRLIFALCRYGGFRCPSELNVLRWSDIDWKRGRITLQAPKTGKRTLPLFPELVPHLKAMPRRGELVFPDYQYNVNLRQQFMGILLKARIDPWPKIFQNLRSTRETELMEQFPAHVVCAWIGNTEAVARKHYLQTTDEHFRKATTQIPTQKVAEVGRMGRQPVRTNVVKTLGIAKRPVNQMLENTPDRSRKAAFSIVKTLPPESTDVNSDAIIGF
jgi:integrase